MADWITAPNDAKATISFQVGDQPSNDNKQCSLMMSCRDGSASLSLRWMVSDNEAWAFEFFGLLTPTAVESSIPPNRTETGTGGIQVSHQTRPSEQENWVGVATWQSQTGGVVTWESVPGSWVGQWKASLSSGSIPDVAQKQQDVTIKLGSFVFEVTQANIIPLPGTDPAPII